MGGEEAVRVAVPELLVPTNYRLTSKKLETRW